MEKRGCKKGLFSNCSDRIMNFPILIHDIETAEKAKWIWSRYISFKEEFEAMIGG